MVIARSGLAEQMRSRNLAAQHSRQTCRLQSRAMVLDPLIAAETWIIALYTWAKMVGRRSLRKWKGSVAFLQPKSTKIESRSGVFMRAWGIIKRERKTAEAIIVSSRGNLDALSLRKRAHLGGGI